MPGKALKLPCEYHNHIARVPITSNVINKWRGLQITALQCQALDRGTR